MSKVEEFIKEFLRELSANWELLPKGKDIDKETIKAINSSCTSLSEEEKNRKSF